MPPSAEAAACFSSLDIINRGKREVLPRQVEVFFRQNVHSSVAWQVAGGMVRLFGPNV